MPARAPGGCPVADDERRRTRRSLAADIKANGLQQPIVVWEDNTEAAKGSEGPFPTYLLDGRNRLAALKLLGIKDPRDAPRAKAAQYTPGWGVRYLSALVKTSDLTSRGMSKPKWRPDVNPITFVLSMNVHRRHLTSAQKREAIAAYLKADPTTSDRKVAKELGVDNKTAAKVRADLEARAEIPHVPTRTDSAGRKQPATKRKPTPKPKATPKPEPIDEDTIAEQPITTEPPGGLTENSPGQTERMKQALENAKGTQPKQDEDDDDYSGPDDDPEYYVKMVGPEFNVLLAETVDHIHRMVGLVKAVDIDTKFEVLDAYSFAVDSVISAVWALTAASKDARAIESQKLKAMQKEEGRLPR